MIPAMPESDEKNSVSNCDCSPSRGVRAGVQRGSGKSNFAENMPFFLSERNQGLLSLGKNMLWKKKT